MALANLAERAADASYAKRCTVLAILSQAQEFTCDAFGTDVRLEAEMHIAPAIPEFLGDTPEDAIALATSLRLLALIVHSMIVAKPCQALLQTGRSRSVGEPHRGRAKFPALLSVQIHDTS